MTDAIWNALWAGVRDGGRFESWITVVWFIGCVWLGASLKLARIKILFAVLVSLAAVVAVRCLMHLGLWSEWYVDDRLLRRLRILEGVVLGMMGLAWVAVTVHWKRGGMESGIRTMVDSFWPLEERPDVRRTVSWGRTAVLVLIGLAGAFITSWMAFLGGADPMLLEVYKIVVTPAGMSHGVVLLTYVLAGLWPCWFLVLWLLYTPPEHSRLLWGRMSVLSVGAIATGLLLSCLMLWAGGAMWFRHEQPCCTAQKTDRL